MEALIAQLPDWLQGGWVVAVLIVVASVALAKLANWVLCRVVLSWARRTKWDIDEEIVTILHRPVVVTFVLCGLHLAARQIEFSPEAERNARIVIRTGRALATVAIFVWSVFALRLASILLKAAKGQRDRFLTVEERTYPLFDNVAKLLVIAAAVYGVIVTWDLPATGWIASAGIAGVVVGLAAQDTLSNLFAGVFIIADAPYKVGDFINLESGERGQVAHIGLRSTRLLTRDDVEITIPNSVMGKASIVNETAGPSVTHRVRVKVSVAYGSDVDQVREILMRVASGTDGVCADPEPRVRFRRFDDSGLAFELLCWIPEPVLRGRTLDALNTGVYKAFQAEGVEIPYPKRDVYLRPAPGADEATGTGSSARP